MVMFDTVKPIDILEAVVDAMRYTGTVTSVTASGSNWSIAIDTTDLKQYEYLTIASRRYKVESITDDYNCIVSGSQAPTTTSWKCEAPYFYHGSPKTIDGKRAVDMVGNEMKYPFICLFEPLRSKLDATRDNIVAEELELWLVFLTKCDANNQTTDHYTEINDMYSLFLRFLEQTENYPQYIALLEDGDKQTPDITRHSEFGLVAKTKGHEDYILNDNLSGVEVDNFKLHILKQYSEC